MDELLHPTKYKGRNYSSMPKFQLIRIGKMGIKTEYRIVDRDVM